MAATEHNPQLLSFDQLRDNYLNYLTTYSKESPDKLLVIAEKVSDLIMSYQRQHQRLPEFKLSEAYLAQVQYEGQIEERNLKYCKFSLFKKEMGRMPTAADIPTLHEMSKRISGIESAMYREAFLSEEKINTQSIISKSRELYAARHERELPLVEQLTFTHGDKQLAQKAAELMTQHKERTGFTPNLIIHEQLIEVAKYTLAREDELKGVNPHSTPLEQANQKVRLNEEVVIVFQTCERTGKIPGLEDFKGIQQQAETKSQSLQKEIEIKMQQEQQNQRENAISKGTER